jgi:hypothetical protein
MLGQNRVRSESDFRVEVIATNKATEEQLFQVFWLCLTGFHETETPNHVNLDVVNWDTKGYTLLYKMYEERLFVTGRGRLTLLYDKKRLIAVSGVHKAVFDPFVFIGGTRSWVIPEYQGNSVVARHLIGPQIEAARGMGGKTFILTFNDGNRILSDKKMEEVNFSAKTFKDYPDVFQDIVIYPEKVVVQGTKQFVLVKELERGYKPKFKVSDEK